ncbi:ACP S-malonyltransferase [Bacillus rhizoplanae]|uniref:ACP S-malonyltransferase n=1 Tax=Bacillus rhizoplanae TaxID=2880966 RepID=UPI003D24D55C
MNEYALLFPGQGSQYVGMGKNFYQDYAVVRELFEEAEDLLHIKLSQLCFEGNLEELTKTVNTQPAILVTSVAMFKVFMEKREIVPRFAAGHSLGEISALTCSGVISFCDAVEIVRRRGMLMQEAVSSAVGAMYVISGIAKERVEEFLQNEPGMSRQVVISNDNSPQQVTISGYRDAVDLAASKLEQQYARVMKLNVSAPFHCPLMKPAADQFKEELKGYSYNKFLFPVLSNVTAHPYTDSTDIPEILARQMVQPVLWRDTMQFLHRNDISTVIDMGPQGVLKNLAVKNIPGITAFAYDNADDRDSVRLWFMRPSAQGTTETCVRRFVTQCLAESVCTKNKNWNEEEYRNGVLIPFEKLQQIVSRYEQDNTLDEPEDAREALVLLKLIMNTKKVSEYEQSIRIDRIVESTGADFLVREPVVTGAFM